MAETPKRLGTVSGTVSVSNLATQVTSGAYSVISTIVICNRASTATTYRISTSSTSATHGTYVAYDATINGNDSVNITCGYVLSALASNANYLVVTAGTTNLDFTAFGVEGP
jgi:hypothetical protein